MTDHARRTTKQKDRKIENRWSDVDGGSAFIIPYTTLRHPNFARLSPRGNKLVMDLSRQYSGFNNGYLCASWALMKAAGWRSEETLYHAVTECEHYRLIQRTQQGGRNRPNLFALTWRRIDSKGHQPLEVSATLRPTDAWKEERPVFMVQDTGKKVTRNDLKRVQVAA